MNEDLYQKIKEQADNNSLSMSSWLRQFVHQKLQEINKTSINLLNYGK
jgi:hypothetical protein